MKILVVDDKQPHRDSATELLGTDHDLTVVRTYGEASKLLQEDGFDVLLTDLFMPAESTTLAPDAFNLVGHEIPIGLILVLLAAQRDLPYIALATDTNHHRHPMSAALDLICPAYWPQQDQGLREHQNNGLFWIRNSQVLIAHAPFLKETLGKVPCEWCPQNGDPCRYCQGTKERDNVVHDRKDWKVLLAALLVKPIPIV